MKLLFVCTGNTCRSCMAEAIFNKLNNNHNIKAYSAGLSVIQHSVTSYNTAIVLKENMGLDISTRKSVQLTNKLVEDSDLILTMTSYMRDVLINNIPNCEHKVFTLNQYVGLRGDVVDPFGGDLDIYSKTFKGLKNSIEILINKLKEDNSINS